MKFPGSIKPHTSLRVPELADGRRLDDALCLMFPENGRRGVQRLIRTGSVRVDGRIRPKGYRVVCGQEVSLDLYVPQSRTSEDHLLGQVAVVRVRSNYAAVYKPGGLHTEGQPFNPHPALEELLPTLFPGQDARLLNRLDQATSGLVLLGLSPGAVREYGQMQDLGKTVKSYLAVVHGRVVQERTVRTALDTCKRPKVRAMQVQDPDPLRWTEVWPLEYSAPDRVSLVGLKIHKGRRHQIRAHMADVGHPVVGDHVYGSAHQGPLLLHHCKIRFLGFEAQCSPTWPEWEKRIAGVLVAQGGL
ncbi:MAG: pseudouridine synthase [Desulfovermiculus sp.]|nr:pseudouridine synthase [Desulfovermiculus sp.]